MYLSLFVCLIIGYLTFCYHKVRQIENHPTANGDVPTSPIVISSCGVLSPDDPSLAEAADTDGDPYEDYPDDEDRDVQNVEIALNIAKSVRELGNKLFKEGKTGLALQKYQSERINLKPTLILTSMVFQSPFDILTYTLSCLTTLRLSSKSLLTLFSHPFCSTQH